jgi:hypothetical protein
VRSVLLSEKSAEFLFVLIKWTLPGIHVEPTRPPGAGYRLFVDRNIRSPLHTHLLNVLHTHTHTHAHTHTHTNPPPWPGRDPLSDAPRDEFKEPLLPALWFAMRLRNHSWLLLLREPMQRDLSRGTINTSSSESSSSSWKATLFAVLAVPRRGYSSAFNCCTDVQITHDQ